MNLFKYALLILIGLGTVSGPALAGPPPSEQLDPATVAGKYSAREDNPSGFYSFVELRKDGTYTGNFASGKAEPGTFKLTRNVRGTTTWTVIEFDAKPKKARSFSYALEDGILTLDTRTNPFTLPDSLIFEFDVTED
jgi:hypothetical protein